MKLEGTFLDAIKRVMKRHNYMTKTEFIRESIRDKIRRLEEKEILEDKDRLLVYGKDAIDKANELGIERIADIPEDMDDMEKIVLVKSILENPEKKGINPVDKIKSKMPNFGAKIKSAF